MADALRVIAQLRARDIAYVSDRERAYADVVVFMDGDTEMAPGTLGQVLPFLKAFPKVGAVTTDELGRIYGASTAVRAWFALKFIKRHSVMKSLSLSRKVLTLTGRFSAFRADAVLSEEMASHLENDGVTDWRYGRIKFLMGDDKSTWYVLIKNGWEMLYLPDVVVYSLETRTDPFFKLAKSLMLRWNGNTLRTNKRALSLGPKRIGVFTWWAVLDQRISMWTTLLAPTTMIMLILFVTPWFAAFYAAWIILIRLLQLWTLVLQGHRMRILDLPLQVFDQWFGSYYKVIASFYLGRQSWGKAKGKTTSQGNLPWSRRWAPALQTVAAFATFILFVGLLSGVFKSPNLIDAPRVFGQALDQFQRRFSDAADRTASAADRGLDATGQAAARAAAPFGGQPDSTATTVVGVAGSEADTLSAGPGTPGPAGAAVPLDDDAATRDSTTAAAGYAAPAPIPGTVTGDIDVTRYGARVDDGRDDGDAIRRALRDAAPGATVVLPAGTLHIDRPVLITTSNVRLRGAGRTATTLALRMTRAQAGDAPAALAATGRKGRRVARLVRSASNGDGRLIVHLEPGRTAPQAGTLLWLGAPNDDAFLRRIGSEVWNERYPYVRQMMTPMLSARPATGSEGADGSLVVSLRDNLDLDLPEGTEVYATEAVRGVEMSGFTLTHEVPGASPADVAFVYENRYPDYQVSALAYFWADGGRLRDVGVRMAGGHAVVFENSYGVRGETLVVDGSWNKGDGGTGYVRFARAFRCSLTDPDIRGIRHVAFQWSSSQNRIRGGRIEVDVNFHGGYSRYNVVSGAVVAPAPGHRWRAVTTTPRTARWAPPDGPGNRLDPASAPATADDRATPRR